MKVKEVKTQRMKRDRRLRSREGADFNSARGAQLLAGRAGRQRSMRFPIANVAGPRIVREASMARRE